MASELKVDKFTGVTTAGSIDVTGEGNSTTTNLQQGLTKCFWRYNISNNTFDDSLNVTSGTDDGTGLYTVTITNDFGSATAMVGTSSGSTSSGGLRETAFVSYAVGSIQCTTAYQNGGGIDVDDTCCHINGDLA
tara:strand:+ start:240 stop:641 length:402 start_codon:yes stop_codon:yes gene_type:complete